MSPKTVTEQMIHREGPTVSPRHGLLDTLDTLPLYPVTPGTNQYFYPRFYKLYGSTCKQICKQLRPLLVNRYLGL